MIRRLIILLLIVGCGIFEEDENSNAITGKVINQDGEPIQDASIVIDYNYIPENTETSCNPSIAVQLGMPQDGYLNLWIEDYCSLDTIKICSDGYASAGYHSCSIDTLKNGKQLYEGIYRARTITGGYNNAVELALLRLDHSCHTKESIAPLVSTNEIGEFIINQDCLPFNYQDEIVTPQNPDGTGELFTITRNIRICAYSDLGYNCSDTLYVSANEGINTTITITNPL